MPGILLTLFCLLLSMETLAGAISERIGCGCPSMKNCPIYNSEDRLGAEGVGPVILERESP